MAELFDVLKDVTFEKQGSLINDSNQKDYPAFIINRFLSSELDCVLHAAEMNLLHGLSPEAQYQYMIHALRKRKRFLKFKKSSVDENVKLVSEYYGISLSKAQVALPLHTQEQLEYMKHRLDVGGL